MLCHSGWRISTFLSSLTNCRVAGCQFSEASCVQHSRDIYRGILFSPELYMKWFSGNIFCCIFRPNRHIFMYVTSDANTIKVSRPIPQFVVLRMVHAGPGILRVMLVVLCCRRCSLLCMSSDGKHHRFRCVRK